jgi:hypothetical protein
MIVANPEWGVAQLEDDFSSSRVGNAHLNGQLMGSAGQTHLNFMLATTWYSR